ncbi:MAG: nucleotidyltransferase domain-containing protein [Gammaproteobacteria bacterium]
MSITATKPPWLVTREKVDAVVQRLIEVGTPKKIILFGSYVRDEVTRDSDLDVLVVADDSVANTRKESVRLRDAVGSIDMPMDILVVRESRFEELNDKVGLIYREASRTGRLVYEAQGEDGGR